MPITQSRFLSVLNAAQFVHDTYKTLRLTLRDSAPAIANAMSVCEHTEDKVAAQSIRELAGMLTYCYDYLQESSIESEDLAVLIKTEQNHFQRNGKKNDKAASYQKQWRRKRNVSGDISGPLGPSDFAHAERFAQREDKDLVSSSMPSADELEQMGQISSAEDVL